MPLRNIKNFSIPMKRYEKTSIIKSIYCKIKTMVSTGTEEVP
jgi:hypothetical protein